MSSTSNSPLGYEQPMLSSATSKDVPAVASSASSVDQPWQGSEYKGFETQPGHQVATIHSELFSKASAATILKVANESLHDGTAPPEYPEWVPEDGETPGRYNCREVNFWTCGFFPGSLYCLLERCTKFPAYLKSPGQNYIAFHDELLRLCRAWAAPLHQMANRTNTHDLGFITQPALRKDWELTGNLESLKSLVRAADNLAFRYDERMKAVRSWDKSVSTRYNYTDKETNFLVIVDSMCNIDLLFYIGHLTSNQRLIDIAIDHATFVQKNLIRKDSSTWHVVNFDPRNGNLKSKHTHQGFSDESTWSRGQAWTILGFTQTYIWTKNQEFLDTAIRLSDHFIQRLRSASHAYPYVPVWDFDAPVSENQPLRDSSAGMIAANGLLLLHQIIGKASPYLDESLRIAADTMALCQSNAQANIVLSENGTISTDGVEFDSILKHATANNNEYAVMRYSNHGLVYADYYFLEFGNQLLRMGMV